MRNDVCVGCKPLAWWQAAVALMKHVIVPEIVSVLSSPLVLGQSCWIFFGGMQWIPHVISIDLKDFLGQNRIFSWQRDTSHANMFNLRLEPMALQQLVVLGVCSGFIKSAWRALIQAMRALQHLRPAIWMKFTEPRNNYFPAARTPWTPYKEAGYGETKPGAMGNRSGEACYAHQSWASWVVQKCSKD